jgi:hypothetical protein
MLPGALQTRLSPQTVQIPFSAASPVLGCVPMGIFPPPFVPPSARSKGSPQGQDWLGCLFLVSSFGHAKEETENSGKASPFSQEFPDEPFFALRSGLVRLAAEMRGVSVSAAPAALFVDLGRGNHAIIPAFPLG